MNDKIEKQLFFYFILMIFKENTINLLILFQKTKKMIHFSEYFQKHIKNF
jgi:hypothetical protein